MLVSLNTGYRVDGLDDRLPIVLDSLWGEYAMPSVVVRESMPNWLISFPPIHYNARYDENIGKHVKNIQT